MSFPVVYNRPGPPTGGPRPGAKALMAWALDTYPTATNLGIYNPRRIAGSTSWSAHASGRAIDIGFPYTVGGTPEGHACAQWLVDNATELGVQQVIYARQIWRNTIAAKGWREYNGVSAHWEHVHAELTIEAGDNLTADTIRNIISTPPTVVPDEEIIMAAGLTITVPEFIGALFTLHLGRAPDAKGLAYYTAELVTGRKTPEQIESDIKNSDEAKERR